MLSLPVLETKQRPILNAGYIPSHNDGEPRTMSVDSLMFWVKRTPECIGVVRRIATDIVTDCSFTSIASQQIGRPRSKLHKETEDIAIEFWRRNFGKQKLLAAVIDWLISGDAYIWKGKIGNDELKKTLSMFNFNNDLIKGVAEDIKIEEFYDEDWNGINMIEVVPSSMTFIDHDDLKVKGYIQRTKNGTNKNIRFSTDEIIHAKFLEIDGKVYGYSPMESDFMAIKTINAIQDYGYNYFANAVKPSRAWLFSGQPNQQYLNMFEEQLKQYKLVANAHGDLIVAGAENIKTERLNDVSDNMEFRQLAIHCVGRIAFSFNMPASILSSILGKDIKSGGVTSDIEDAGYYKTIKEAQNYWETLLNTQLFNEFKVEMKFEHTFRQDMIRQVQYMTQAGTVAEFMFKHEFPLTDEFYYDLMQVPRKYLIEGKIKRVIEEMNTNGININNNVTKKQSKLKVSYSKYSEQKKKEQKPQEDYKSGGN